MTGHWLLKFVFGAHLTRKKDAPMRLLHTAYISCQQPLQVVQPRGCHLAVLRYSSRIAVLGPGLAEVAAHEYHSEVLDVFEGPGMPEGSFAALFPDRILILSTELAVLREVLLRTGRAQAGVTLQDICDHGLAIPRIHRDADAHQRMHTGRHMAEMESLEKSRERLIAQLSCCDAIATDSSSRRSKRLIVRDDFAYVFEQNKLTVLSSTLEAVLDVPWTSAVLAGGLVYVLLDAALVIMDGFRAAGILEIGGYAAMRVGGCAVIADTVGLHLVSRTTVLGHAELSDRIVSHATAPDGSLVVCFRDGGYSRITTVAGRLHLAGMALTTRLSSFAATEDSVLGVNGEGVFLLRDACVVEQRMFGSLDGEPSSLELAPKKCCCADVSGNTPDNTIPAEADVQRLFPTEWQVLGLSVRGSLIFVQTGPSILRIFSTARRRATFVKCFREPIVRFEAAEILHVAFEGAYELFYILHEAVSPCFRRGSGRFLPRCRCPRYAWAPGGDKTSCGGTGALQREIGRNTQHRACGVEAHVTPQNRLVVKTEKRVYEKTLHADPTVLSLFRDEVVVGFENEIVFYKLGVQNILNKKKLYIKNPRKFLTAKDMLVVSSLNGSFRVVREHTIVYTNLLCSNVTAFQLFSGHLVVGSDDLYVRVYRLDTFVCVCSFFVDGVPLRFAAKEDDAPHGGPRGASGDPEKPRAGSAPGCGRPGWRSRLVYCCTNGRAGEFVEIGESFEVLAAVGGHGFSYRRDQFGVVDRGYVSAAFDHTKKYRFRDRVIYRALRILNGRSPDEATPRVAF